MNDLNRSAGRHGVALGVAPQNDSDHFAWLHHHLVALAFVRWQQFQALKVVEGHFLSQRGAVGLILIDDESISFRSETLVLLDLIGIPLCVVGDSDAFHLLESH